MKKQIEPIIIIDNIATILNCCVINYDGISCTMWWGLYNSQNCKLIDGNWNVPQSIIENWGTDDSIIIEALAEAKGFKIIK